MILDLPDKVIVSGSQLTTPSNFLIFMVSSHKPVAGYSAAQSLPYKYREDRLIVNWSIPGYYEPAVDLDSHLSFWKAAKSRIVGWKGFYKIVNQLKGIFSSDSNSTTCSLEKTIDEEINHSVCRRTNSRHKLHPAASTTATRHRQQYPNRDRLFVLARLVALGDRGNGRTVCQEWRKRCPEMVRQLPRIDGSLS